MVTDNLTTLPQLLARFELQIERVRLSISNSLQARTQSRERNYVNARSANNHIRNETNNNTTANSANRGEPGGSQPGRSAGSPSSPQSRTTHLNAAAGRPGSSLAGGARVASVTFSDPNASSEVISQSSINNNNYALLDSGSSINTVPNISFLSSVNSSSSHLGIEVKAENDTLIPVVASGKF